MNLGLPGAVDPAVPGGSPKVVTNMFSPFEYSNYTVNIFEC